MDDKNMKVSMSHIPGEMVKTVIDGLEQKGDSAGYLALMKEIGECVAVLHNNGIVHHDLTTSNMILHASKQKVYLIDFGLSFFSDKTEDYAVDLHLLRHALESRHHRIWEECFSAVCSAYKNKMLQGEAVLARLDVVEKRGRYKTRH
ncbi:Kae1-associated serine/threonine protein kinase [Candidatus Woesearchaeota archaeon]|nr:Kae1-associated serine/threonine protein kinase [Candidatus Woesearchaeota archaeon]